MPKIWLKKFSPDYEFIVAKPILTVGEMTYTIGETFDKNSVTNRRLRQLYESRRIGLKQLPSVTKEKSNTQEQKDLTTEENSDIVMPVIVRAGPRWKRVMLGEEQIGKTIATDEEAQAIIDEWLANQNN